MKPEPIFIKPGTFSLAGAMERDARDLEAHIERLQGLLGDQLQTALAGVGDRLQNEPSALITFTGAFTGLSTLLHFCSFTRGVVALERGMETRADQGLAGKLRALMVPIVLSQCEILNESMAANLEVKAASLQAWYRAALAEVVAVRTFIGRMG
ncbi:MAG: hypothetical protein P4L36_09225 [Holophaga sp.]|nr:hypothetical protein [Holophaga sp.]